MTDRNASTGLVQLKKLEPFRRRRLEVVRQYDPELSGLPGIRTLEDKILGIFPHNYVIRILDGRRDRLVQELAQRGIDSGVHFNPCHMQPLYARGRSSAGDGQVV